VLVDDAGPDVGYFGPLGELVDDEGVELLVAGHRDMEQEVLAAGDDEHAHGVSGSRAAQSRNASMLRRDGGRIRTAIRA